MEFDVLKELAKTITRNKIKNIEVLGNKSSKKTRLELLFEGLTLDVFKTEKEAVRHLFKSHDVKNLSYQKLKNKLIRQLNNTIFFIDVNQPAFNDRAKCYYMAHKDFAAANLLQIRNAFKPALQLLQIVLEQSMKYEFVDLAADAAKLLRRIFARVENNFEKNQYYTKIHRFYEEKRRFEFLALDYYETLISYYSIKRSSNKEINKISSTYFSELLPLTSKVDTSAFYYYTYNIGLIKYMSINDHKNTLRLCDEAINILGSRSNTNREALSMLYVQKLAVYTQIKFNNKSQVKGLLVQALSLYEEGGFSWFRTYEVYFYYCIYSKQYDVSLEIWYKITNNSNFGILEGSYYENWILLGGYLHLLSRLNKLDSTKVEQTVGPFRYSKLHNEIEILNKEKDGMNIPLVLLPVLYELALGPAKRTKEIHIDALEKYRQRWLANDLNKRSNCFFKMLLAYAKDDTLSASTQRKINREYEILKSETPEIARQNFAIEIIPYEDLWEMLMAKVHSRQPGMTAPGAMDVTILPKGKGSGIRNRT